jgi:hypothetical protein
VRPRPGVVVAAEPARVAARGQPAWFLIDAAERLDLTAL